MTICHGHSAFLRTPNAARSRLPKNSNKKFHVSGINAFLGNLVHGRLSTSIRLGDIETFFLKDELANVPVRQPVFVAGLARSGSTILLELLSGLPGVVTHRYRDFPPIFTPYWWNWLVDRVPHRDIAEQERDHRDRIRVTPESPEAMEEPIWMAFFANLHNPTVTNALGAGTDNAAFENFYTQHIQKLLLIRNGTRYVSKGNYNLTRIEYLLQLFPDAKFLVPVRDPVGDIASLIKQHKLFCDFCENNPRALKHLARVGHFEFGADRRPINTGNHSCAKEILGLWNSGDFVRGWARYWRALYSYVADRLDDNRNLAAASLPARYEDLCQSSAETMYRIITHCGLEPDSSVIDEFTERLTLPDYYRPSFSEEDLGVIEEETRATAARFGY